MSRALYYVHLLFLISVSIVKIHLHRLIVNWLVLFHFELIMIVLEACGTVQITDTTHILHKICSLLAHHTCRLFILVFFSMLIYKIIPIVKWWKYSFIIYEYLPRNPLALHLPIPLSHILLLTSLQLKPCWLFSLSLSLHHHQSPPYFG